MVGAHHDFSIMKQLRVLLFFFLGGGGVLMCKAQNDNTTVLKSPAMKNIRSTLVS